VRLGRERTRKLYVRLLIVAYFALGVTLLFSADRGDALRLWPNLAVFSIPLAFRAADPVLHRTDGPSLNGALGQTGALLGAFSVLVSAGLLIAS
jgi:1,4-dihydroxy-2-naphthoate octaprenyltransferase